MQAVLRYFRIAVYPLVVCFIVSQAPISALAQGSEQVTVTTYYPSPVGNFNELAVGTSLNFDSHSAIRYNGTNHPGLIGQDVVHFMNYAYEVVDPVTGEVTIETYVAIGFTVPVLFKKGVTFNTDGHVIFYNNIEDGEMGRILTVHGNVLVDNGKRLVATSLKCESGNYQFGDGSVRYPYTLEAPIITADGNITSVNWGSPPGPGHLSAPQVRDTTLGLDLGASLVNGLEADNALLGKLALTQTTLTAGFGTAAVVCSFFDWGAALAFGALAGIGFLGTMQGWIDYLIGEGYTIPAFNWFIWNDLYTEPVLGNTPYEPYVVSICPPLGS